MSPRHIERDVDPAVLCEQFRLHPAQHDGGTNRCNRDLRTPSSAILERPMSASSRSSSSRSSLYWVLRNHFIAIPASHGSGFFQDHLGLRDDSEVMRGA